MNIVKHLPDTADILAALAANTGIALRFGTEVIGGVITAMLDIGDFQSFDQDSIFLPVVENSVLRIRMKSNRHNVFLVAVEPEDSERVVADLKALLAESQLAVIHYKRSFGRCVGEIDNQYGVESVTNAPASDLVVEIVDISAMRRMFGGGAFDGKSEMVVPLDIPGFDTPVNALNDIMNKKL